MPAPETLAEALARAHQAQPPEPHPATPEQEEEPPNSTPTPTDERSLHARARKHALAVAARTDASLTPAGDEMRAWLRTHASEALQVYVDALSATKGDRLLGEIPDHNVRVKAADALLNRAEGMPVSRTEVTGAGGGPLTLQALLAADVRDTE